MDATLWIELGKAALAAVGAGAQVFADRTKTIEERLGQKPRVAGRDIRDELRKIEGESFED